MSKYTCERAGGCFNSGSTAECFSGDGKKCSSFKAEEHRSPLTSYLYDQIPRDFWADVKSDAALKQLTIRDYITNALEVQLGKRKEG